MIECIATFNETQIDKAWYTDVTTFAQNTHWLNTPLLDYSSLGMALFAVFVLTAWWTARGGGPAKMAAALAVPIAAVAAYADNDGIKWVFSEQRPCYGRGTVADRSATRTACHRHRRGHGILARLCRRSPPT